MKIKWYGHAAFNILSDKGESIIIDPYQSGAFGGALSYGPIKDEADIVLVSHDHDDHNYTKDLKGRFEIIKKAGTYSIKDIFIKAISSYHDPSKGKERGDNLIFVLDVDNIKIAHMGDLGHTLSRDIVNEIGPVDILLIPVGGFYTIDSKEATKVVNDIKPVITIPMHFKTEKCNFPIAPVEEFTKDKKNVKIAGSSEIVLKKATFPKEQEVIVLRYAL